MLFCLEDITADESLLTGSPGFTDDERSEAVNGFVTTLMWSTTVVDERTDDEDGQDVSEREPVNAEGFELSDAARAQYEHETLEFIDANAGLIRLAQRQRPDYTLSDVAHDFALTRNHHGAGFWDRGLGEHGHALTDAAHAAGAAELYLADDGLLYAT